MICPFTLQPIAMSEISERKVESIDTYVDHGVEVVVEPTGTTVHAGRVTVTAATTDLAVDAAYERVVNNRIGDGW